MKNFLAVTALAVAMSAGVAFAQTSGTSGGNSSATQPSAATTAEGGQQFKSDNEKMMYQENSAMLAPFFTDDTMSTMKSEDDVKAAFAAMDSESQAGMKTACEKAMEDRGSYGTVTTTLCQQVMAK